MKRSGANITSLVVAAIFILVLISLGQYGSSGGLGWVREGYSGVARVVKVPFTFVSDVWTNYIYLVSTRQENELLKQRNDELAVRSMRLDELQIENRRLRGMLNFKKKALDFSLHPASLLTQDITLVFKTATLDRGTRDGFALNTPVVTPAGVIGRTIDVTPRTSQVLLITDANSAIPALLESSRVKGILKGRGERHLTLEYVRRSEDIAVGDTVVTSGLLGIFPKGLPIGQISKIERDEHEIFARILVTPSVEMDKIEEVFGIGSHVAEDR